MTLDDNEVFSNLVQQPMREEDLQAGLASPEAVGQPDIFDDLADQVDGDSTLDDDDRRQVQDDLNEIQNQILLGREADPKILLDCLRRIEKLAPDVAEVLVAEIAEMAETTGGPLLEAYRSL